MIRFVFLLLLIAFVVTTLAIFITPFSGECATKEYVLRSQTHNLDEGLCPHPNRTPCLSKSAMEKQVDFLQKVVTLLKKQDICFFAFGSTLSGAVHNQGYLPWTDRNDLAVFLSELSHLVAMRPVLEQNDLLLIRENHGYRICQNNWSRFPFVFLTLLEDLDCNNASKSNNLFSSTTSWLKETRDGESKQKMITLERKFAVCTPLTEMNAPTWVDQENDTSFSSGTLFPVEDLPFEDFTLPCPNNPTAVIHRLPKHLRGDVPANDFDVVFMNNRVKSLRDRVGENVRNLLR
mmetsp:Transcript_3637/g.5434  ORF Transcript_3637/g.5434 Transcript_3637/m.5434 type:complete len:291 (+) Transcript_3637:124-996(+)